LTNDETRSRAEALFIRKEKQAREGSKAMAEYMADRTAEAQKTERLRVARLAREAEVKAQRGAGQESRAPQAKRR